MSTDDRYAVPALMRGLQLLTQFSRDEKELTGAELARRLGAPRASVFRLLHTLEQLGFVERVGEAPTFRLGVGVLRLGFEYLASMELTELGKPVLDTLRDATGLALLTTASRSEGPGLKAPRRSPRNQRLRRL